jgi:hypothetical protein
VTDPALPPSHLLHTLALTIPSEAVGPSGDRLGVWGPQAWLQCGSFCLYGITPAGPLPPSVLFWKMRTAVPTSHTVTENLEHSRCSVNGTWSQLYLVTSSLGGWWSPVLLQEALAEVPIP